MKWFDNYKTIIGSVAGGLLVVAHSMGYLDGETFGVLAGLILTFTGVSLRLAIKKVQNGEPK